MSRNLSSVLGLLVLSGVWLVPLQELLPGAFAAHMAMHMGVVAVGAPLVAYGVAGGKLDLARRAPALFPPIPVSVVELVVVWVWHAPALHHAARRSDLVAAIEQTSFLVAGLWVWLAAFGGASAGRDERGAAGVVALLLTSMHMTLLGALLALSPRALYVHAAHGGVSAGSAQLEDQHLGGAIMLVVGGVSYLLGGLCLTAELLRRRRPRQPALARTGPRPSDAFGRSGVGGER